MKLQKVSCTRRCITTGSQIWSGCNRGKRGRERGRWRERGRGKDIVIRGAINCVRFWHASVLRGKKNLEQGPDVFNSDCFHFLT